MLARQIKAAFTKPVGFRRTLTSAFTRNAGTSTYAANSLMSRSSIRSGFNKTREVLLDGVHYFFEINPRVPGLPHQIPNALHRMHGNAYQMIRGQQTPQYVFENGIKARGHENDFFFHLVNSGGNYVSFSTSTLSARCFAFGPSVQYLAVDHQKKTKASQVVFDSDPRFRSLAIGPDAELYHKIKTECEQAYPEQAPREDIIMARRFFGLFGTGIGFYYGQPEFNPYCQYQYVEDTSPLKAKYVTPVNAFRLGAFAAGTGALILGTQLLTDEKEESEKLESEAGSKVRSVVRDVVKESRNKPLMASLLFSEAAIQTMSGAKEAESAEPVANSKSFSISRPEKASREQTSQGSYARFLSEQRIKGGLLLFMSPANTARFKVASSNEEEVISLSRPYTSPKSRP